MAVSFCWPPTDHEFSIVSKVTTIGPKSAPNPIFVSLLPIFCQFRGLACYSAALTIFLSSDSKSFHRLFTPKGRIPIHDHPGGNFGMHDCSEGPEYPEYVDPEVLQSGFGVNFFFWSPEFSEICPKFLSELVSEFSPQFFRPFSSRASGHPKELCPKLSAFLSNVSFLNQFFITPICLRGRSMYVVHIFYLEYSATPKYRNVLGNFLLWDLPNKQHKMTENICGIQNQ